MPMNPVDRHVTVCLVVGYVSYLHEFDSSAAVGLNVDNVTCMLVARCSNAHPLSFVYSYYRYFSFQLCI